MSGHLPKRVLQLLLNTRLKYRHPITYRRLATPLWIHTFDRKFSSPCTLPVTLLQEDDSADEFDDAYIYDFPADVTPETYPAVCELMQEIEILGRFHFHPIPKCLSSENWRDLLGNRIPSDRKQLCEHLFYKEKRRELRRKYAQTKREFFHTQKDRAYTSHVPYRTNDVVPYKFSHNSMFNSHILRNMCPRIQRLRVLKSAIFGPHIIIDCCYESYMNTNELLSCMRQITMLRKANHGFPDPFNITFCNMNINGELFKKLCNVWPDALDPASTFHYTQKSFVDLFPREKLCYLSPNAETELEIYDPESVYVIGALVDHIPKPGLSNERAHLNEIRTVKFPLDRYINWCKGTQCLMFSQAVNIIHDLKEGVPWQEILLNRLQHEKTSFSSFSFCENPSSKNNLSTKYIKTFDF